jgi:sugar-specific transcriptional regulator TrmB
VWNCGATTPIPPEDLAACLVGVISRFNLGAYEITTYLARLQHGELTASEIAERTSISQPQV